MITLIDMFSQNVTGFVSETIAEAAFHYIKARGGKVLTYAALSLTINLTNLFVSKLQKLFLLNLFLLCRSKFESKVFHGFYCSTGA